MDEWTHKTWRILTAEFYSAIEVKGIPIDLGGHQYCEPVFNGVLLEGMKTFGRWMLGTVAQLCGFLMLLKHELYSKQNDIFCVFNYWKRGESYHVSCALWVRSGEILASYSTVSSRLPSPWAELPHGCNCVGWIGDLEPLSSRQTLITAGTGFLSTQKEQSSLQSSSSCFCVPLNA